MSAVFVVLVVAMCAFMLTVGPLRVIGIPIARSDAARFGIPFGLYRWFGVVEVLGAIGLLIGLAVHPLAIVTSVLIASLAVGALVVHVRAGEPAGKVSAAALVVVLAVVIAVLSTLR